ncbi:Flagellar basal body-associated protein FliL [uncultured Stenotrophomonas sp.]|uniref:Flagellar protein FliL n=1 Tax=uncultured Stenotrophomonas sp. TaxID=165438 RepID=A0A1Y5Q1I1_9GAMM|nr:Flagellar basal body-associated protein FliL [uncultured Stenotrophomonas sp.]
MAAAADKNRKTDTPKEKDSAPQPQRSMLMVALIALIAAAAAGGGVWYFTQHQANGAPAAATAPAKAAMPAPAQYFALDPAFVVNLNGPLDGPRYLQVEVQLMTRNPQALTALQTHAPAIRAQLLMLFSQVEPAQIADRAGREKLQQSALAEVQKLMTAETGSKAADDLLFTSFVTQ